MALDTLKDKNGQKKQYKYSRLNNIDRKTSKDKNGEDI
jgi:L-rhamnose isomerase